MIAMIRRDAAKRCITVCVLLLLCISTASLSSCNRLMITMSPAQFLSNINDLAAEDFGALSQEQIRDETITSVKIRDRLSLTMTADPFTGLMKSAVLKLSFDENIEDLDYSSFAYFFLIMLKAYDSNISIANVNAIRESLSFESYNAGIDNKIGYGSTIYYYTVTEKAAIFTAQYITEKEQLP